ncbi:hypothetical protein [Microcystis aeruginosa]|uniref:hypothetical protein n=1 Tax=Microcystis aeruginosa TaxID=1126 RepID=UPI001230EAC8|nr:hypothetical protein [Microcystis aeruginosa]GCA90866.1 hypothetical protein MiTa_04227 [Microcystis aeruginosa NIES-4264]
MNKNSSSLYESWDDSLEDHRSNPHKLIDWIKQNHPDLVEKAKNGNLSPETIGFWQKVLNSELVRVNPRDLHGDVMVTDAIEKESKRTAGIQTISNMWNTVGVVPIAYAGVGAGVSGVMSAGIVFFLSQSAGNYTSTAASNANPASRKWANAALASNISLQVVLTLISGVGSEILTNSAQLSKIYADKVVEERLYATPRRKIAEGQGILDQAKVDQDICDQKKAEYHDKRRQGVSDQYSDPKTSPLYVDIYGPFEAKKNPNYFKNYPTTQLPICIKPQRLEHEGNALKNEGQQKLDLLKSDVDKAGGSLPYLKNEQEDLYAQNFTENGRIAAGQEAVSTSMGNFSSKLLTGEWDKLGFPLMFASLSVIFSSASILMTLWHRNKPSIALTFDPTAKQAFDELIHAVAEGLNNQEPPAIDDDKP